MGARGRNLYRDLIARYGYPAEADRLQEWDVRPEERSGKLR